MKHIKIGLHELIVVGVILFAFLIRLGLISQGWPLTNSDEGTIGLMSLHIAFNGEHPTFYYGQYYMGPHQAFLGALLFRLFPPSLFTLRLGLLLVFTLFLGSTYLLARLIYSKGWALMSLFLLSAGSIFMLQRELMAIGGYTETLLFGSLLLLLSSWLVITYHPYQRFRECRWRLVVYFIWGLIAGTALWDDLLVIPFVLMGGCVLAIFCWREQLQLITPLVGLIGLILGIFPLLYYNLFAHPGPGQDTLSVTLLLSGANTLSINERWAALFHTIDISVPMMTGEPFCQANELPFMGPLTSYTPICVLTRQVWGYGYLLLLLLTLLLALWSFWQAWRTWRINRNTDLIQVKQETARWLRRQALHLMLLLSGVLTLYLYVTSRAPLDWPGVRGRYLIGLLIITPAVFWPLWQGFVLVKFRAKRVVQAQRILCGTLISLVCTLLIIGSITAYAEVPEVRARNEQDQNLIETLAKYRVSHIYSEYWTCNKITFLSNERVICASVNTALQEDHNRYYHYYTLVKADPKAAYVFPLDSSFVARTHDNRGYTLPALDERARSMGVTYQVLILKNYIIYLPR